MYGLMGMRLCRGFRRPYYAVGELLRMVYEKDLPCLDGDLRKLSRSNTWQDDSTHPVKRIVSELFKLSATAVNKA
jgi:hypothetical protein